MNWLRKNLWAVFLFHQFVVFLTASFFLLLIRTSGRNIHLGQTPMHFVDGAAVLLLCASLIGFTWGLYRVIKDDDGPPLGIGLSARRFLELVAGLAIGSFFAFFPWAIALANGSATVVNNVVTAYESYFGLAIAASGFFLLLVQAMTEETVNRAFPLRLWQRRPLWFRILLPAVFFVVAHLISEPFSYERAAILLMAGILQSFAYLITGNIWFSTGIHAGANFGVMAVSGLWDYGALVNVEGQPAFPNWAAVLMLLVFLWSAGIFARKRTRAFANGD